MRLHAAGREAVKHIHSGVRTVRFSVPGKHALAVQIHCARVAGKPMPAADTLDGKVWLPEVGKATHYHAAYVRPYWVREMAKMYRVGVHTFYRPRRWGDGAAAPAWGSQMTDVR